MAVSSSDNFNLTRNEIIADVLVTLGVYRPGATVSTADYNICSNMLNKLVKSWDAQGIHMWSQVEGTLFLTDGQNKYTLSSSASDRSGNDVVETTLTAAASTTSLTVTSTTGMTAADNIGIVLDDNTLHWTTIVSVDSSTGLTITAAPASSGASGNGVFTYTTHASKPINISSVRLRDSNGTDRPVYLRGRDEFMSIPSKSNEGKTNQVHYTAGRDTGTIYLWPTPDSVSDRLKYTYTRMIYDLDSGSDNADFPSEWLDCIHANLAYKVAGIYGKSAQERAVLRQDAKETLIEMQLLDVDAGSVRIVPSYRDDE